MIGKFVYRVACRWYGEGYVSRGAMVGTFYVLLIILVASGAAIFGLVVLWTVLPPLARWLAVVVVVTVVGGPLASLRYIDRLWEKKRRGH